MRKSAFRVKPNKHPTLKFLVRSKITGKWQRKFFRTRVEAETYARLKETELLNQGRESAVFPTWLRVMAERENERLRPYGKTLSEAVDYFLRHIEAVAQSIPLSRALAELIANRKATGASDRYCNDLRLRLSRFAADHPNTMVAEVTTKSVDDWLAGLPLAAVTRNTFRRDLRTLFSFCVTRRYTSENPVTKTRRAKEVDSPVGILTVSQISCLLSAADEETVPYWSIGAFAGLRRAEIERLDWSDIDLEGCLIEIKARYSKTSTRRLVTIQPNLKAWLQSYHRLSGSVCPDGLRIKLDADRARCGLFEKWPQNGLRHSFGSYHLAHFRDTAALALQMGNSPEMIFRHYRQLVKPKAAEAYWNVTPSNESNARITPFRATA